MSSGNPLRHYWREAAIISPNLWSKINSPQPELMELFLSWSGAYPMELYAHSLLEPCNGPPPFRPLVPHLDRLRSLSFQISQKMYGADYLLAEVTVPSLERLHIGGVHGDSPDSYPAGWISRFFTRNTQVPRLQHLCPSHILFISPFMFNNPSHLHFDDVPFLKTQLPAVLGTLAYNTNLRGLLLSQSLGTVEFDLQPLSNPHIPLRSLQRFFVKHMSAPRGRVPPLPWSSKRMVSHYISKSSPTTPIRLLPCFLPLSPVGLRYLAPQRSSSIPRETIPL